MSVKGEIVDGVRGARIEFGTVESSNPASIAAGANGSCTLTISGADTTDLVFVSARELEDGLVVGNVTVTGTDTVTIELINTTAGAVDGAAQDFDYVLIKRAD